MNLFNLKKINYKIILLYFFLSVYFTFILTIIYAFKVNYKRVKINFEKSNTIIGRVRLQYINNNIFEFTFEVDNYLLSNNYNLVFIHIFPHNKRELALNIKNSNSYEFDFLFADFKIKENLKKNKKLILKKRKKIFMSDATIKYGLYKVVKSKNKKEWLYLNSYSISLNFKNLMYEKKKYNFIHPLLFYKKIKLYFICSALSSLLTIFLLKLFFKNNLRNLMNFIYPGLYVFIPFFYIFILAGHKLLMLYLFTFCNLFFLLLLLIKYTKLKNNLIDK